MIAFSCACGQKFKVKPEYAGRKSTCPTCKQPLVVPTVPEATHAYVPQGEIDGSSSSLDQAGLQSDVTLAPRETKPGGQPSVHELLARRSKKNQRYVLGGEIARGGMGAVLRAADCDLRREVAVKFMLDGRDAKQKLRFVEEAQITGQLEHPNIVPIHELGIDSQQRLFFAMKMVKGRSLAQILDELRASPKTAEKEWPLSRLLTIFVGVCNALAYAHSRNVVHRDLKPANIMVGDFGEVYVMDWGLAKVMKGEAAPVVVVSAAVPVSTGLPTARSGKVVTNRGEDADLTQDGAVLGTPVYMSPEQATGQLQAIDQRSDIYSLGAILYEMLTLQPPVEKEGGHLAVLMRVAQGEIISPEQRNPQRAKGGKIPRELAAVAMKAMAKEKEQRYRNVENLHKDIERFQEGRSVSAKEYTTAEMLWKLVKRNKGFSAGMAAALLVLVGSLFFLARAWQDTNRARQKTEDAYANYREEQKEKERRTIEAVPAFVAAARMWVENHNLDGAVKQVDLAILYDSTNPDAHLLKGQVLVAQKNFDGASAALDRYLKLRPGDADAKELVQLCRQVKPDDGERILAIYEALVRQKALRLSDYLREDLARLIQSREKLVSPLRKRIELVWPKLSSRLVVEKNGKLSLNLKDCGRQVRDLSPLRGVPLDSLNLQRCDQVQDLSPLHGMPLTWLDLGSCERVSDLTPLRGTPLTLLSLWGCNQVRDLTPLQGIKLTYLNLHRCTGVRDLAPLRGMPLTSLNLEFCDKVRDLTPLQGMKITSLNLVHCDSLRDLTPLRGMPLTSLNIEYCDQVRDLTPLEGMKLTRLGLPTHVTDSDLTVLRAMPLRSLWISFNHQLRSLKPLQGVPLESLQLRSCRGLHDLTGLKGMPLTSLNLIGCEKVRDLTPLAGMELQAICVTPKYITKGMDALREMKSLKRIGVQWDWDQNLPAAEFWKRYDAGEFK